LIIDFFSDWQSTKKLNIATLNFKKIYCYFQYLQNRENNTSFQWNFNNNRKIASKFCSQKLKILFYWSKNRKFLWKNQIWSKKGEIVRLLTLFRRKIQQKISKREVLEFRKKHRNIQVDRCLYVLLRPKEGIRYQIFQNKLI
jgi:hypothetical protein